MNPNLISVEGLVLPNEPLSNIQLISAAKKLKIKNFKGVFVRDRLPEKQSRNAECGILNLDSSFGPGTHWTVWYREVARAVAEAEKTFTLTATDCDLRMNLSATCKDLFSTTVSVSSRMDKYFADICVFTFLKS